MKILDGAQLYRIDSFDAAVLFSVDVTLSIWELLGGVWNIHQ